MITSEQINEIATAMAKAQAALKSAAKDATNPAYNSKYADLTAVWGACRGPLTDNGIAVWQDVTMAEGNILVRTRLAHSSGQWVELGPLPIPLGKISAHGVGSAISYGKRYALAAAVGIVAEDDDDGNAANAAAPESAFKSKQLKTKYWNGIKDAASNDDSGAARELWDELDNEQREEVWRDLSSGVRSTFKALLAVTAKPEENSDGV